MMALRCAYFVTGTDTEIGKTLVSSALLHGLAQTGVRAAGMKPVAAGADLRNGQWHNEDADRLAAETTLSLQREWTTPYLLQEAAAPHIAAQREGVSIDLAHILRCYEKIAAQADAVVVEGVGGFCVPLGDDTDTADLAKHLALPVIMVVGLRLGCISHALLTAQAIAARGLTLAGWVANRVDADMTFAEENVEALRMRLPAPLLGIVPRLAQATATDAARYLDFSCLPGWPGKHTDTI
jgi:dethiobiotin synthetase